MIYYKVKSKKENISVKGKENIFQAYQYLDFFIAGELLTKKEIEKMLKCKKNNVFSFESNEIEKNKYVYNLDELIETCFDKVNINKNKTVYVFGSRKEINK